MIAFVSCLLAVYEALAYATGAPKITELSHRKYTAPLVWGWWAVLGVHFFLEARHVSPRARACSCRPLR